MKSQLRIVILGIALCSLVFIQPVYSQTKEVLTNESVVGLIKSGLASSIIIKKIRTEPNRFDLSTTGLVALTNAGVPEDILNSMMEAEGNRVSEYHDLTKTFDKAGIYYVKGELVPGNMSYLEPAVIDKTKEGSFGSHMARALTAAAKKKVKAIIANEKANLSVSKQPVFLFYFGDNTAQKTQEAAPTNTSDPMAMIKSLQNMSMVDKVEFSSISSPNEMRLVKTDIDSKERSFVASSASGMSRESGIDTDYVRDFKFEKLDGNLYRVYFDTPLESGEYLFILAGVMVGQGQYVYDFSVK